MYWVTPILIGIVICVLGYLLILWDEKHNHEQTANRTKKFSKNYNQK